MKNSSTTRMCEFNVSIDYVEESPPAAASGSTDRQAPLALDSASDASPRPGPAPTPAPALPRPAAPSSSVRLRRRGAAAAASSPRSSRRTLPHELQDANSPSARRRRTAPQWPHQHSSESAIDPPRRRTCPAGIDHSLTGVVDLYDEGSGVLHIWEAFRAFVARDRDARSSVIGFRRPSIWNVPHRLHVPLHIYTTDEPRKLGRHGLMAAAGFLAAQLL